MKKFFKNIILLLLVAIVIGEVVVRLTHAVADVPQRTIDEDGIQKYVPNQEGYWKGGDHKWIINKLGWPGELPTSYDNLIMIIGDSFIENFMNPNECHQSIFLKESLPNFNFMEASRSGVSLIEALEISKQLDSLKPRHSVIYINDADIYESVFQISPMSDITQLNIKTNTIEFGEMKAIKLKKILYTWKLMYYLYNRFPPENIIKPKIKSKNADSKIENIDVLQHQNEISKLINYIINNYKISNKTLVFHPDSSDILVDIFRKAGFNTIQLDSRRDKTWTFDHDSHWTCYGHKQAASQVAQDLFKILSMPKE